MSLYSDWERQSLEWRERQLREANAEIAKLKAELVSLTAQLSNVRQRLLTVAGDDLCRLTQEEIKAMTSGAVQIPPREEFLASCERFHAQIAGTAGVNSNCLTLAQLVAENERLRQQLANTKCYLQEEDPPADHDFQYYSAVCGRCFAALSDLERHSREYSEKLHKALVSVQNLMDRKARMDSEDIQVYKAIKDLVERSR